MKKVLLVIYAMIFTHVISFTQVSVGGIAFVGYNADNPDQFTIILTEYLAAGTQMYFSDAGWTGSALYASEGAILWTVPAGDLPTNTMVTFTGGGIGGFTSFPTGILEAGVSVSHGSVVASGVAASMAFSTNGDEILAFTGSIASPVFIACLNFNGAWSWTGANSSEQTLIPPGLTDGLNCALLPDRDNGIINCLALPDPATVSDYNTAANWIWNDVTRYTLPPTIGTCEFLLPLTLLSFTGENVLSANELTWVTANELNVLGFEIERSANAVDFVSIAFIAATGENAFENGYQFIDDAIAANTFYYRLKIMESDFGYAYSPIIAINTKSDVAIKIYPNPVNENGTISIASNNTIVSSIKLFDGTGRLIKILNAENIDVSNYMFNTADLVHGIYTIEVVLNGNAYSTSFIK